LADRFGCRRSDHQRYGRIFFFFRFFLAGWQTGWQPPRRSAGQRRAIRMACGACGSRAVGTNARPEERWWPVGRTTVGCRVMTVAQISKGPVRWPVDCFVSCTCRLGFSLFARPCSRVCLIPPPHSQGPPFGCHPPARPKKHKLLGNKERPRPEKKWEKKRKRRERETTVAWDKVDEFVSC
jgi:hypothetical protein